MGRNLDTLLPPADPVLGEVGYLAGPEAETTADQDYKPGVERLWFVEAAGSLHEQLELALREYVLFRVSRHSETPAGIQARAA